jgi:hypothetical protein
MFVHCDTELSPWYVVEADVKRNARLNMIHHLISTLPYERQPHPEIDLPPRPSATGYERPPRDLYRSVPDHAATLVG